MKRYISYISNHKKIATVLIAVTDILFFASSDPNKSPVWLMAIGFSLLALSVYIVCRIAANLLVILGVIKSFRNWVVLTTSVLIFLVLTLQALGQLSTRDILALIPLVLLGHFYFNRVSLKDTTF